MPGRVYASLGSVFCYGCMKQAETNCGRGFDSRHLHQRYITPLTPRGYLELQLEKHTVRSADNSSVSLMGVPRFRRGWE